MKTITVTFPIDVSPETFKRLMEAGVKQFSKLDLQVHYKGCEDGENDYMLASYDVGAFYFAGIVAANILQRMDQVKSQVHQKN